MPRGRSGSTTSISSTVTTTRWSLGQSKTANALFSLWLDRVLADLDGLYCENCNIARAVPADATELLGVRPWARDPVLAERLWTASVALTGVTLPGYRSPLERLPSEVQRHQPLVKTRSSEFESLTKP
jgi:hypothetical protein